MTTALTRSRSVYQQARAELMACIGVTNVADREAIAAGEGTSQFAAWEASLTPLDEALHRLAAAPCETIAQAAEKLSLLIEHGGGDNYPDISGEDLCALRADLRRLARQGG